MCRNYANYSLDRMNEDLSKINWQPIYNCKNVSNALERFCSTLKNVFDQHTPLIEKGVKGRKCPWLTSEIRRKMSDHDKLLQKACKAHFYCLFDESRFSDLYTVMELKKLN